MPLKPLPDQGIEVPLSEYNRLRAFQGGGWFWDHDNQQIIREALGDFLPRVEERRDKGGALFQQFVRGVEATSRSQAIGAQMNRVPKSEHTRLQRALENLKAKAQDPNTDPNARRVIEKFCLPDPAKDPDLYRLYGSRWNRRLLVLWGCEREEGSSLAPSTALNKMPVEAAGASFVRRLPLWIGLLLLLALLALGLREVWHRNQSENGERPGLATNGSSPTSPTAPAPGISDDASLTEPSRLPGNGSHPQTKSDTPPGTGQPPEAVPGGTNSSANPAVSGNPPGNQNRSRDLPYNGPDAALGALAANATPEPDATPSAANLSGNNAAIPPASRTGNAGASPDPSERLRNAVKAALPRPGASPSPSAAAANNPADGRNNNLAATGQPTPRSGAPTPAINSPQAPEEQSNALATSTPSAGNAPRAMPPAGNDEEEEVTQNPTAQASMPPTVDILKAQVSSTPHDGKMDMVLIATAHEADKSLVPFQVTVWNVDGVPQHSRSGKNVTSGQLALTLSPGKHRVGVAGTARGLPVQFETEVNVQIKSQGDVTLKARGQP